METNTPRSTTEPVMFETQDLPRQMMQRANDEIESLRQRVAELEKERDEMKLDAAIGRVPLYAKDFAWEERLSAVTKERDTLSKAHADLTKMYNLLTEDRDLLLKQRTTWEASVFKNVFGADEAQILDDVRKQLDACQADAARYRQALELIAVPKRKDGTYNRCREACEVLAREALNAAMAKVEG